MMILYVNGCVRHFVTYRMMWKCFSKHE